MWKLGVTGVLCSPLKTCSFMDHIPLGHIMVGEGGYHRVVVLLQSAILPLTVILNLAGNHMSTPPLSPMPYFVSVKSASDMSSSYVDIRKEELRRLTENELVYSLILLFATAHRAPRIHLLMMSPAVTMATCSYVLPQGATSFFFNS